MIVTNTIEIAAPVERVWSLTVDIENWPSITPTVTWVVRRDTGPLAPGSTARVKQPRQRARVWTVTQVAANETFSWQARIMGMPVTATHSMTPSAPGSTSNTLTLEMAGPIARVLGPVLASTLRRTLAQENEGFKQRAEG